MKIKHLFGLAVIAAMSASCSSNEDLGTAGPGTGTNEAGVSYASFSINLPTTSGTRAAGDPTFEPGSDYEYKVNDATLLIFKKGEPTKEGETPKEGDYTFVESAELGSMAPWQKPNPDETGVTTHAKITAELKHVDKNGEFFALVLLNNGTGTNTKVAVPTIEGMKFSDWNAAANAKDIANYTNGFYMANAPLFKNNNVTTLVAIDKNKIYPTEEQAAKSAATDIYVERGLAKVTLKTGTAAGKTDDNYTVTGVTYKDDHVTIKNWALDVTNKKTFPIHNVDGLATATDYKDIWSNTDTPAGSNGATTLRFVDNKATLAQRVYWGKDPNYDNKDADKTALKAEFNNVANEDVTVEPSKPLYCLENTFNLANMMQGQTTRVVFKATYKPASLPEGETTFYKIGKNTAIWSKDNLEKEIKAAVASVVSGAAGKTTVTLKAPKNDITAAGTHYITKDNISVTDTTITITPENIKAINTQLGLKEAEKVGISTYAGGDSYYIARIKHFGDDLTKWESGTYDEKNLEYLGRYGVLRNNWYELTVQSVSGPGYPSVPDVKPNTPDDEDDKYINVSVKILDWAKRSQNVNL
jgi:hypothetical protein